AGSFTSEVLDPSTGQFRPASPSRCTDRACCPSLAAFSSGGGSDGAPADYFEWTGLQDELSGGPCLTVSSLLGASSDGREGSFAVLPQQRKHGRLAAAVAAVRFVEFSDGQQLVSWCSNATCTGREQLGTIFSGQDFPHQPGCTMLCGMEPLCECGLAVVRTAGSGSASALAQLLGSSKGTDTPGRQVPWQLEGTELQCMRADSGWGNVGRHGAAPWCLTCRSQQRSCPHVSLLLEGDLVGSSSSTGPTSTWLPPAKSEERFVQDFDLVAGQRRLTCLSRERLPARPQDDPELHQLLTDRKAGNYKLPPVAAPSERACPDCSTNSWTVRQGAPCTVFMQTHSVSMRFDELVCACGCVLQVDGKELGLLRVKPGFAGALAVRKPPLSGQPTAPPPPAAATCWSSLPAPDTT
ncbi:hypothetical protein ABPG75_012702, partial [Micractinium tetrahymenae]